MRMDRYQRSLLQLPEELVKRILFLLALTGDGAKSIARVLLVSKRLKEMAMSAEVLRVMSFGQAQLPNIESAWSNTGLILESARASNPKTYKEIMMKIKVRIDAAFDCLESITPLLEECSESIKGRDVVTRSINKRIMTVITQVRMPLIDTDINIMSAEWRINEFGRQFFQNFGLNIAR